MVTIFLFLAMISYSTCLTVTAVNRKTNEFKAGQLKMKADNNIFAFSRYTPDEVSNKISIILTLLNIF